jgi:hypothetical protein
MLDKSTSLVLEALGRAVAEPAGMPLHCGKGSPGLFAASAPAKQAAQRCKEEGFLRVVQTESRGKGVHEICALTEKGLAYLLEQVNPKPVLEDLVRVLEARASQVAELVSAARQTQARLEALKAIAEKVLARIQQPTGGATPLPCDRSVGAVNGGDIWIPAVLSHLRSRRASGVLEDCPLPELFRIAQKTASALSIGHFHDAIRRLHGQHQLYLHPWTGPLPELPEPSLALLIGHEIAYYASAR